MLLSVGWVRRWVAVPSVEGWPRVRRSFPPSRGPAEGSAEGVSSEVELACLSRVGFLPSSEAEMERAARGLGGEASSEAENVPRVQGGLEWAVPRSWAVGRVQIGLLWDLEWIWVLWES